MSKQTSNKFSPEVRSRAVRLVLDHEAEHRSRWTAIMSIAAKIGCTPQTLLDWVKKAEVDSGTPVASWAGVSHGQHMRASCSMRWSRLSMIDGPFIAAGSCTTATTAAKADSSGRRNALCVCAQH